MSWHYQVRKRNDKDNIYYDIVEMYENPIGWTKNSMSPCGETYEEIIRDLQYMLDDARQYPVFEEPT
jgi:hypothetical protein